ncbi:hypothetical protein PYCCODRAFT_1437365 [Trametes coccinea BRFM310]|uniref:F-box domain-containing protein n=1 Tax=Trametes coccinea (strain BRFM310) TaxID=1353009 RepID=A0A1Y2IH45_TRAC3|nr:hypothetical protein PYCCODRAFT_1437365 [Trametes coccinea BRFM310]
MSDARTLVLMTDELLRHILRYLTRDTEVLDQIGMIDRNAIRRCAEVSRAFNDVAIDILWEKMKLLSPLTDLLPSFCCIEQTSVHHELMVVRTGGLIQNSEWTRFQLYARRIRALDYDHSSIFAGRRAAAIHPDVMLAIAQHSAPQAALPRLQNMKSRMVYLTVPYSQLTNLAPTSLRSLSITLDYCEEQPISYLEESWDAVLALLPRCPDLASIHFAASISLDHPEQCLHLVVKGHSPSKLRTLSLRLSNDCAVHFVWDLAPQWFSSLETLKIDTSSLSRNRCQRPLSSIPASSGKFLFLVKKLKLYTSILRAAALLSATTSKTLMSLGLKFRDVRTNADQPLFLDSLATPLQQFSSTLQYLSISLHWEWGRALVETALEPVTPWLGPLLSLHGLVEFNIYAEGMTWILSTTDIWSMARAWPHITWLQVKDSKYELMGMRRDRDLQMTPIPATVLLAFAEHCPNLQYLSLVPLYLAGEGCSVLENWHPSADSVSAPQLRVLVTNILPLIEETPGPERLKTIEPPSQMQPFLNAIFPNAYCVFWAWRSQFVRIQPANQHI